jgi:hypothetical protein
MNKFPFMDPKDQALAIGPYSEPVQLIHILRSYLFRINFNIVLPSTSMPLSGLSSLKLCLLNISHLLHPRPAHLWRISSLYNFFYPSVSSALSVSLGSVSIFVVLFLNTLPSLIRWPSFTPTQNNKYFGKFQCLHFQVEDGIQNIYGSIALWTVTTFSVS